MCVYKLKCLKKDLWIQICENNDNSIRDLYHFLYKIFVSYEKYSITCSKESCLNA